MRKRKKKRDGLFLLLLYLDCVRDDDVDIIYIETSYYMMHASSHISYAHISQKNSPFLFEIQIFFRKISDRL